VTRVPQSTPAGGAAGNGLPPRRGLLGPTGPDEFPEFDGYRPSAARSQIDPFTADDAAAILFGDGTGHGGHAFGLGRRQRPPKSEFPEGWAEAEVIEWVRAIVDIPVWAEPAGASRLLGFDLFGEHRGVRGVVHVNWEGRWVISSGYPRKTARP
jgi:hypothetical protein